MKWFSQSKEDMSEHDEIIRKKLDFQTPPDVCRYMVSLVPPFAKTVFEPTPGSGNIVEILKQQNFDVTAPEDFFKVDKNESWFDCVVMNPPFAHAYAFNVPQYLNKAGMRLGYHILLECMQMSNNIIALMPWFTISDSDVRLRTLKKFGLRSITSLPRKTFKFARIQTLVIQLEKGYDGPTEFIVYDLIKHVEHPKLFADAK
jgi:type I restriction-modification system DNA methylase subunit